MRGIDVRAVRTTEIEFKNELDGNGKLNISTNYSYNVRYGNANTCRGEFTAVVSDKDAADKFFIKVTCVGIMSIPENVSREDIHRASYDVIFPYVRAAVTGITAGAGIPPLYLPHVDISGQDVYRIEIPHKE